MILLIHIYYLRLNLEPNFHFVTYALVNFDFSLKIGQINYELIRSSFVYLKNQEC